MPTLCGKQGNAGQGLDKELFNMTSIKKDTYSMYMYYGSMSQYMGLDVTKTVFRVTDQAIPKQTCSATETT